MYMLVGWIEVECLLFLLYIVDLIVMVILQVGICKVGLFGIVFIMEQVFYCDWLQDCFGLQVLVLEVDDCCCVYDIIYQELIVGVVSEYLWQVYVGVIVCLVVCGVEVIIFGCIEIMLLVCFEDSVVLLFDIIILYVFVVVDVVFV